MYVYMLHSSGTGITVDSAPAMQALSCTIYRIRQSLVYLYKFCAEIPHNFCLLSRTNSNENGVIPYRLVISVSLVSVEQRNYCAMYL